jgi:hypothetical protein
VCLGIDVLFRCGRSCRQVEVACLPCLSLINSVIWRRRCRCRCKPVDGSSCNPFVHYWRMKKRHWRWSSRFFCIELSVEDHGHVSVLPIHLRWDLAGQDSTSTCSYALQVLQQSIFACRVATDDTLKGLIALDVVGDAL